MAQRGPFQVTYTGQELQYEMIDILAQNYSLQDRTIKQIKDVFRNGRYYP